MSPELKEFILRLTSRKFLLALAGIIAVIAKIRGQGFIHQDDINAILAIIAAFNVIEGIGDASERYGFARSDIRVQDAETINVDTEQKQEKK